MGIRSLLEGATGCIQSGKTAASQVRLLKPLCCHSQVGKSASLIYHSDLRIAVPGLTNPVKLDQLTVTKEGFFQYVQLCQSL